MIGLNKLRYDGRPVDRRAVGFVEVSARRTRGAADLRGDFFLIKKIQSDPTERSCKK